MEEDRVVSLDARAQIEVLGLERVVRRVDDSLYPVVPRREAAFAAAISFFVGSLGSLVGVGGFKGLVVAGEAFRR